MSWISELGRRASGLLRSLSDTGDLLQLPWPAAEGLENLAEKGRRKRAAIDLIAEGSAVEPISTLGEQCAQIGICHPLPTHFALDVAGDSHLPVPFRLGNGHNPPYK
jgi:hypothetical protein